MTRDMKVYGFNKDCDIIISEINQHRNSLTLRNDIAIFELIGYLPCYLILSVSDAIDSIVEKHGGKETNDSAVETLRTRADAYPLVFGDKRLTGLIPYIIPYSANRFQLDSKSGRTYDFRIFNLFEARIRENAAGVYLFTVIHFDKVTGQPSHLIKLFESVANNNTDVFVKGSESGAKYYAYYYSSSEEERQQIIKDIKDGPAYKYQLMHHFDIVGKFR